ncbi:MAG: polyphosphate kinase 2 family protein [Pseudomonadota bacterium]|nr:polyphosphate kinase 2 family protein [Pseudomonadota bacterium]
MFHPPKNRYQVPFNGGFRVKRAITSPDKNVGSKKDLKKKKNALIERMAELQRVFYAHDRHALLLVFQAMDAAGKDGTIRHVMSGINPSGCQVFSFKQPSAEELDHDFLWRTNRCLPERGRIGIFNRSYYEETLVVRVHPEYLEKQKLPNGIDPDTIWKQRFESIRNQEKHLARNGTVILKFWLNVSKEEQRNRFLARLNEPDKNWKFSAGDVRERQHWGAYMQAYQDTLNATSRSWAPWYAIPADDKPYMRYRVAQVIVDTLEKMKLHYPEVTKKQKANFKEMRKLLTEEND